MAQIQPRPRIVDKRFNTYRYRRVTSVGGKKVYVYYDSKLQTYGAEKSFETYIVSPPGTFPLNRTLSPFSQTEWAIWPRVDWRDNPDNTFVNTVSIPVTSKFSEMEQKINDIAIARCIEKVKEAKVDLLTLWAERQKTADMLRHRLMQSYFALRAIKKGDLSKAIRIIKNGKQPKSLRASDMWLEFIYGWSPFLSDIEKLCKMEPPIPDRNIREPFGKNLSFSENLSPKNPRTSPDSISIYKGKVNAVCFLQVEIDTPFIVSASQLGLTNPLNTLWEIVPFSFVIDWFIPIQRYIEQYDALDGIYIRDKLLVTKTRYVGTKDSTHWGSSYYKSRKMARTMNFNLNPPPYIKSPVSFIHCANALALIRSLKGGARGWRYG